MSKRTGKSTCNQCHEDMDYRTDSDFSVCVCTNPACPNYGLLQIAAEQMPKEKKTKKK